MKRVAILGSTGSIGVSALNVIARFPELFRVVGLAAGRNVELLSEQIEAFRPKAVAVFDEEAGRALRTRFPSLDIATGNEGVLEIASRDDADFILSAIVGSAGLSPTLAAVKTGKVVGIANKESLVMAGDHINALAALHGARIIPVDSEHSAIFQCLQGQDRDSVSSIILTASGGPFAGRPIAEMKNITVADALNHPRWSMGRKVTIDSATLMNKGLEVIEAHHLFQIDGDRIKVIIHPQSVIHSMVEFKDGSLLAQLSAPDMSGPIAYALSFPGRLPEVLPPCRLSAIRTLTFEEPDQKRFPCLALAYQALRTGGTAPAFLNGANEVAVNAFLEGKVPFEMIPVIIERAMGYHKAVPCPGLPEIMESDSEARGRAALIISEEAA